MIVETYDSYFEGVCELDVSRRFLVFRYLDASILSVTCGLLSDGLLSERGCWRALCLPPLLAGDWRFLAVLQWQWCLLVAAFSCPKVFSSFHIVFLCAGCWRAVCLERHSTHVGTSLAASFLCRSCLTLRRPI